MTPEQLVQRLQTAIPDALHSVVLYGSAVAGDFIPGKSNYNILVVAQNLGPAVLDQLGTVLADWLADGNDLPMLFTLAEFHSSADTFPIEFADIQQSRKVLFGPDLLHDLKIDPAHLRLQLEREWTGKLLALRRQYLLARNNDERLAGMVTQSLSSFLVLMRAALRLFPVDTPALKLDALDSLSQRLGFDPQPFRTVHTMKMCGRWPLGQSAHSVCAEYLRAVEQVATAIDRQMHQSATHPHV